MVTDAEQVLRCANLVQQVADAHRRAATEALVPYGVTQSASGLLWLLGTQKSLTMRAVAHSLSCDPSNVTLMADTLERVDLVERVEDHADRRRRRLQLTGRGRQAFAALTSAVVTNSPLTSLTAEQLSDLSTALSGRLDH